MKDTFVHSAVAGNLVCATKCHDFENKIRAKTQLVYEDLDCTHGPWYPG